MRPGRRRAADARRTWLQGLRRGKLSWDLASLATHYLPARCGGSVILDGLVLELCGKGQSVRRLFPPQCFDLTLQRALEEPLRSGALNVQDKIHYWLSTAGVETAGATAVEAFAQSPAAAGVRVCLRPPAWQPEPARLRNISKTATCRPGPPGRPRLRLPPSVPCTCLFSSARRHGSKAADSPIAARIWRPPHCSLAG